MDDFGAVHQLTEVKSPGSAGAFYALRRRARALPIANQRP
jgi:hypothetical protein